MEYVLDNPYVVPIVAFTSTGLLLVLAIIQLVKHLKGRSDLHALENHKSEFLALAAHYFLTPLSIIRGNIAELLDPQSSALNQTERQVRYLTIQANTNHLLRLVQNITVVAAIDSKQLQAVLAPVEIMSAISDCIAEVHAEAAQKNISIRFGRPETLRVDQVSMDREKFRQAVVNILGNAVKFTNDNGIIEVTLTEENEQYIIHIADSGVGIAPDEVGKLFTRFHRGTSYLDMQYEGIGLGLYIAKYLIEANGGHLTIESKVNKGTIATIVLPR